MLSLLSLTEGKSSSHFSIRSASRSESPIERVFILEEKRRFRRSRRQKLEQESFVVSCDSRGSNVIFFVQSHRDPNTKIDPFRLPENYTIKYQPSALVTLITKMIKNKHKHLLFQSAIHDLFLPAMHKAANENILPPKI